MDELVHGVPAMEGILRFRDLPSFCRASDVRDPILQSIARESRQCTRAQGHILNTFEELEGPILSRIRTPCPNVYPIGPQHAHLKLKLASKKAVHHSLPTVYSKPTEIVNLARRSATEICNVRQLWQRFGYEDGRTYGNLARFGEEREEVSMGYTAGLLRRRRQYSGRATGRDEGEGLHCRMGSTIGGT